MVRSLAAAWSGVAFRRKTCSSRPLGLDSRKLWGHPESHMSTRPHLGPRLPEDKVVVRNTAPFQRGVLVVCCALSTCPLQICRYLLEIEKPGHGRELSTLDEGRPARGSRSARRGPAPGGDRSFRLPHALGDQQSCKKDGLRRMKILENP